MKKKYTLDRIEGDVAVCISRENGETIEMDAASLLAAGVSEGGIFSADLEEKGQISIEYLAQETEEIKADLDRRLSALFNRRKGNEE